MLYGGVRALQRADVGRLTPGSRADAVVLDYPLHTHVVYRPGVPLVAATVIEGRLRQAPRGQFPSRRLLDMDALRRSRDRVEWGPSLAMPDEVMAEFD